MALDRIKCDGLLRHILDLPEKQDLTGRMWLIPGDERVDRSSLNHQQVLALVSKSTARQAVLFQHHDWQSV